MNIKRIPPNRDKYKPEMAMLFLHLFPVAKGGHLVGTMALMPQARPSPLLVHDDTFRRLCRARDLLAAEYQSQILLDTAAGAKPASLRSISTACSARLSARRRTTSLPADAWTAPAICWLPVK